MNILSSFKSAFSLHDLYDIFFNVAIIVIESKLGCWDRSSCMHAVEYWFDQQLDKFSIVDQSREDSFLGLKCSSMDSLLGFMDIRQLDIVMDKPDQLSDLLRKHR